MNNDHMTDFQRNIERFNSMSSDQRLELLVKRTQADIKAQIGVSPLVAAARAVGALFNKGA